jgi:plastocyanin
MRGAAPLRRALGAALALCAAALGGAPAAAQEPAARIEGRVVSGIEGMRLADVAPVVVYLDGVGQRLTFRVPRETPSVHQRDARFQPRFLAVVAGQSVRMPNDDAIYHNVFSYSKPNDFDLGLYPAGESRSVALRHPGVVKTYCSIHETMNGTIFVAPSPWFDVASQAGDFALAGIPPGRYQLAVWSESLPRVEREVRLAAGQTLRAELVLGAASAAPAALPNSP